jgi:taurine--2-oxoglutarate transaminase
MSTRASPRSHLLLPWAVQEREDPVLEFDHAQGMYFYDRQGRRYLDFLAQVFHGTLGHGNRRVIEAIGRQAQRACVVSPQMLTPERAARAAELARRTPGDLNRCFFVNSGSEANDQAFILARLLTGRPKVFAKYRSYHGTTYGTLGVAGVPRRSAVEPGPTGTVRFFDPYCYRCDFGLKFPDCRLHCLDALERQLQLENPATVAAVVVEPFTGAAGGFPLPDGYLPRLRQLCDRHGILLTADEVITARQLLQNLDRPFAQPVLRLWHCRPPCPEQLGVLAGGPAPAALAPLTPPGYNSHGRSVHPPRRGP